MTDIKYAACCLAFNSDGQVLMVTRPKTEDQYGLPGGKVNRNETPQQAALRELQEETGYIGNNPTLIFADWCRGEDEYYTFTYLVNLID